MRKKGFSLLDLVITLSLLSILLCISLPFSKKMGLKYLLKSTTREICANLNYARYKSIFQKTKYRVRFFEKNYAVERYNSIKKKWEIEKINILRNVIVNTNNNPVFHPNGTVSNLASIYISNSTGKYKITIAISGRIKISKLNKD